MADRARNETKVMPLALKKNARHDPIVTVTDTKTGAIFPLTGYTFIANLLDKQGGTILDSMTVGLVTDGSDGKYQQIFEIVELAALIAAGTTPKWWEFFAIVDSVKHKWLHGRIIYEKAGDPAP